MQKPDADGYVTITWPSKTIPHGGVFHNHRVEPSPARQQFLKVLLEESKLDMVQRKKSAYLLRREEDKPPPPQPQMPCVRPRTSKRRSLSAIRESGIYDVDLYKPLKRGEDREKLKERLANFMAYGDSPEQTIAPPPAAIAKPKPQLPTEKEKWNDLLTQIRERAEWLAEMEELGHAEPHREIIKEQIAERLRALDALDIDSECFSVRSGFTAKRSVGKAPSARSNASVGTKASAKSSKSGKSQKSAGSGQGETQRSTTSSGAQKASHSSARGRTKEREENVAAYGKFSPLQYSPRRRV